MASESPPPPPQSLKGELWDTAPDTFLAREAIKRLDLKECYLSDDAVMKILINKSEKTITGVNISRFNNNVFLKGGYLKSKHKGRGAPALAPDGTVMTMLAGVHRTTRIVLNGGDDSLIVGDYSIENYQAKSDHPKFNEWLAKNKWTAADALRAGIPLTSINATVTTPANHVQQTPSEPGGDSDALRGKKEDSPQLNDTNGLGNEVQPNNADNSMNQDQENRTPSRSATPLETPLEETPSEYATLSSTYSEITTSKPTTPEPSPEPATSEPTPLEPASSEPVIPQPVALQPITPEPVASQSSTSELTVFKSAASEPTISEPAASDLAVSEPATLGSAGSEPVTSDLDASQPVALEPTISDTAASALEPTVFESATSELATSEPLVSKPTVSKSDALQSERSASEPVTTNPTVLEPEPAALEPGASKRAASEPIPLESFASISIEFKINSPEAPKPNTMQSQPPASVRKQSASPGPALMKIGPKSTVGLGIYTGSMEQTTPKHSVSMFRQHSTPRQRSLEIPETPPPSAHHPINSETHMPRERTPTISLEASRMNNNHTTISTGRHSSRFTLITQPAYATHQAASFQTPPSTPASNGSLKRKATEPLDKLITFYVGDGKSDDTETFNFSEHKLKERAPKFYELFKDKARRVQKIKGPVYDIDEKPKLFEAILHWIDKGKVMRKSYSAPENLECYYVDLYFSALHHMLPGLANAIIDKLYDWHRGGTVEFQKIDEVYSMTEPGDGLRRLYFGCMMTLTVEEFEATPIEQASIVVDLFAVKRGAWGGLEAKEAYHNA